MQSCSDYCKQLVKTAKNEARTNGIPIGKDIEVLAYSHQEYCVYIGDLYNEQSSCCESGAVAAAIHEIIDEM